MVSPVARMGEAECGAAHRALIPDFAALHPGYSRFPRPHPEEPAEASAKAGVSKDGAAACFETRSLRSAPQHEADGFCGSE